MFIRTGLALALGLVLSSCIPTVGKRINEMGFNETRPPTTLVGPGRILTTNSVTPFEAINVCASGEELGTDVPIERSETETVKWSSKTSRDLKISADFKDKLNVLVGGQYIKEILLTISNAEVFTIPDSAVIAQLKKKAYAHNCIIAISKRIEDNYPLTMVQKALKADVVYEIEFSSGLNVDVQAKITADIAPKLGAKISQEGSGKIFGSNLYFGIVDSRHLMKIYRNMVPGLQPDFIEERDQENGRLIPLGLVLDIPQREN